MLLKNDGKIKFKVGSEVKENINDFIYLGQQISKKRRDERNKKKNQFRMNEL